MIEKFNATFILQITKLQDRESNNWDEFLTPIIFAYNTGWHAMTKYAPYEVVFGKKARFVMDRQNSTFTFNKSNDYYEQLKKSMKIINVHTPDNSSRKQSQYKIWYDRNTVHAKCIFYDKIRLQTV